MWVFLKTSQNIVITPNSYGLSYFFTLTLPLVGLEWLSPILGLPNAILFFIGELPVLGTKFLIFGRLNLHSWTKNMNDHETTSQPRVQTCPLNRLGHRVPQRLGSRHSGSRCWDGHSAFEPIPEGKSVQKCELYVNSMAIWGVWVEIINNSLDSILK